MRLATLLAGLALLVPGSVFAAGMATSTLVIERSPLVARPSLGNAYIAGATVAVTAPTGGDLSVAGGSVVVTGPVTRDALLAGGSISLEAPVSGNARLLGGTISITDAVSGDLVAIGASVSDEVGGARDVLIAAVHAALMGGAKGPVSIYANDVSLAGNFAGDVTIIASGRILLAENTVIHGVLSYESPEEAGIPASATITDGVQYRGPSYLPSSGQAHALVLASFGVFLFVRFLASIILAGLMSGLFPELSDKVSRRALKRTVRSMLLTLLLGFAILIATPVLLLLLALTFVGLGIVFLVGAAYVLLCILAFVFGGILVGALLRRYVAKRDTVRWHDGALGMFVLLLVSLVPVLGVLVLSVVTAFAAGALVNIFYYFAFPKRTETVLL